VRLPKQFTCCPNRGDLRRIATSSRWKWAFLSGLRPVPVITNRPSFVVSGAACSKAGEARRNSGQARPGTKRCPSPAGRRLAMPALSRHPLMRGGNRISNGVPNPGRGRGDNSIAVVSFSSCVCTHPRKVRDNPSRSGSALEAQPSSRNHGERGWGTQHVNDVRRRIGGEVVSEPVLDAGAARVKPARRRDCPGAG